MGTLLHFGVPGLCCACYVLMLLSAVFRWVNGEVAIVSLAALGLLGRRLRFGSLVWLPHEVMRAWG